MKNLRICGSRILPLAFLAVISNHCTKPVARPVVGVSGSSAAGTKESVANKPIGSPTPSGQSPAPTQTSEPAQTSAPAPESAPKAEEPSAAKPNPEEVELDKACTPETVEFNNQDPEGAGKIFLKYVKDPEATGKEIAHAVCKTLYKKASEVRKQPKLTLTIKVGEGVAYAGGSELTLLAGWIGDISRSFSDQQMIDELRGVQFHELTHLYQNSAEETPGWLVEGIADFVRHKGGYNAFKNRVKGGSYTDSYGKPAFFFVHLSEKDQDFVYKLNQLVSKKWPGNDEAFRMLAGDGLDNLWNAYQMDVFK